MADIVDVATRSRMMRAVRSKDTEPEIRVRQLLHKRGLRFRLHDKSLPGKPDLVFPRFRGAVFVHGCFWHGHDCSLFKMPGTRLAFWCQKFNQNQARDGRVTTQLLSAGWRVAVVWECALKGRGRMAEAEMADTLAAWLSGEDATVVLRERNAAK